MKKLFRSNDKTEKRDMSQEGRQETNNPDTRDPVGVVSPQKSLGFNKASLTVRKSQDGFQLFKGSTETTKRKADERSKFGNKSMRINYIREKYDSFFKQRNNNTGSNTCFSGPGESTKRVKIIRKQPQYKAVPREVIAGPSKKSEVEFVDLKEMYGITPENSSSESDSTLLYGKECPYVYERQSIEKLDKSFQQPDNSDSTDHVSADSAKEGKEEISYLQPSIVTSERELISEVIPSTDVETDLSKQENVQLSEVVESIEGLLKYSSQNIKGKRTSNKSVIVNSNSNRNEVFPTKNEIINTCESGFSPKISNTKTLPDHNIYPGHIKCVHSPTAVRELHHTSFLQDHMYNQDESSILSLPNFNPCCSHDHTSSTHRVNRELNSNFLPTIVRSVIPISQNLEKTMSMIDDDTSRRTSSFNIIKRTNPLENHSTSISNEGEPSKLKLSAPKPSFYLEQSPNTLPEGESTDSFSGINRTPSRKSSKQAYLNTSKSILAFHGQTNNQTPFENPYRSKEILEKEIHNQFIDMMTHDESGEDLVNDSRTPKVKTIGNNNSQNETELNINSNKSLSDVSLSEQRDINTKNSVEGKIKDSSNATPEVVYVGKIPNTTYNVFFATKGSNKDSYNSLSLDENETQDQNKSLTGPNQSGPKGLLIFVNKINKLDVSEYDDTNEYSSEERISSRSEIDVKDEYLANSHKPSRKRKYLRKSPESGREPSREHDYGKRSSSTNNKHERSQDLKRFGNEYKGIGDGRSIPFVRGNDKERSPHESTSLKRSKKLKRLPMKVDKTSEIFRPGRFLRERDHYGTHTSDEDSSEEGSYYRKYSSDLRSRKPSKKSSTRRYSGKRDVKRVTVYKSPSESKIAQKYPCGCLRIVTVDPDKEEFISEFCKDGSLCEVQHPELQKTKRIVQTPRLRKSLVRDSYLGSRNYALHPGRTHPNIEIFGIVRKNTIPESPPAPTLRGANLTGSISVKSNKLNAICNLYVDPRLLKYILENIEKDKLRQLLRNSDELKFSKPK